MFRLIAVLCYALAINGQLLPEEAHPAPEPYSFAFSSPNEDGTSSTREESGDASGRVVGSYTILGADGQQRRVEYVADKDGFRANVITNEIGTESQNAADTQFQSSAPTAAQLNAQWEASGAGRVRLAGARGIVAPAVAPLSPALRAQVVAGGPLAGPLPAGPLPGPLPVPVAPVHQAGGFTGVRALRLNQGLVGRVAAPVAPIAAIPKLSAPIGRFAAPALRPIARGVALPAFTQAAVAAPLSATFGAPFGGQVVIGGPTPIGAGHLATGVNAQALAPLNAFGIRVNGLSAPALSHGTWTGGLALGGGLPANYGLLDQQSGLLAQNGLHGGLVGQNLLGALPVNINPVNQLLPQQVQAPEPIAQVKVDGYAKKSK